MKGPLIVAGALAAVALCGCVGFAGDDGLRPGAPEQTVEVPPFEAVAPVARRLTREEYLHTVQDVLGVTLSSEDAGRLPDDLPLGGFVNTAQGQATLPDHVRAYGALATVIASSMDFDAFVQTHAPCLDGNDSSCVEGFVDGVGALLFRRPLEAHERAAFTELHAAVRAEDATFQEASRAVFEAMMQSPQFLYLTVDEVGPSAPRVVSGYAMSSRLSYFLWLSAPDAELLRAAREGELDDAEGVAAQAARMLDDPRARRSTARFIFDWARLATLPDGDGLKDDLVDSTVAFYQHQVWESGEPLLSMLTAPRAALTPALAERWMLQPQGDGARLYDISGLEGRVGLLGQPGIIAGMTNADGGEIVARGLFLLDQLFCRDVPSPPSNLQEIIDGFLEELPEGASERMIAETRLERPECASCHAGFDPLAYGFEQLDYRGGFRTEDEHGNVVRTDGWIPASYTTSGLDEPYEDLPTYVEALSTNPLVQRCFAQRYVEHAIGTQLGRSQSAAAQDLAERLVVDGGDYRTLVDALVRHDVFRTYTAVEASE